MEKIINSFIPQIGEQIFESVEDDSLVQCHEVSQTWKVLAEKVLLKRWKGKMFEACKAGKTQIVKLLLEHCNSEESGLSIKAKIGMTLFLIACNKVHSDVVKLLLDFT